MPRTQPKSLSRNERNHLLNLLWSMVTVLKSREEVENFFRDLLSETEAVMLARRIAIAQLLLEGKSYDDIQEEMHAGHSTIAGVHRWLQSGSGGYEKVIPNLEKEIKKQSQYKEKLAKQKEFGSLEWLKKRYPLHFLLLNLMDTSKIPASKKKIKRKT